MALNDIVNNLKRTAAIGITAAMALTLSPRDANADFGDIDRVIANPSGFNFYNDTAGGNRAEDNFALFNGAAVFHFDRYGNEIQIIGNLSAAEGLAFKENDLYAVTAGGGIFRNNIDSPTLNWEEMGDTTLSGVRGAALKDNNLYVVHNSGTSMSRIDLSNYNPGIGQLITDSDIVQTVEIPQGFDDQSVDLFQGAIGLAHMPDTNQLIIADNNNRIFYHDLNPDSTFNVNGSNESIIYAQNLSLGVNGLGINKNTGNLVTQASSSVRLLEGFNVTPVVDSLTVLDSDPTDNPNPDLYTNSSLSIGNSATSPYTTTISGNVGDGITTIPITLSPNVAQIVSIDSLADGTVTIEATPEGNYNRVGSPSTTTITKDTVGPDVTITGVEDSYTSQTAINIDALANDALTAASNPDLYVTTPSSAETGISPGSYMFTDGVGSYQFRAESTDSAGNQTTTSKSIYFDNIEPTTTIDQPMDDGDNKNYTFNSQDFESGIDPSTLEVFVGSDELSMSKYETPITFDQGTGEGSFSIFKPDFALDTYRVEIRGLDQAGNVGSAYNETTLSVVLDWYAID